jgi:glycosyltransferase involved in cell wall biosynthesis
MTILFLMISYPDISKDSSMYIDLTQEFVSKGHNVYVVVANGPNETKLLREGCVNVLRIRTLKLFNTSAILKGIANELLPYQFNRSIEKTLGKIHFDAVILPTPPITFATTVKRVKKIQNSKIYLILRDIFPQNARDLGILNNKLLFNYFRQKEKKLYAISDYIGCMSIGNIEYIKANNHEVNIEKLHLLQNWKNVVDYSLPDISIRNKYDLSNKFVVLYGGNLGKPQQAEFILELSKEVRNLDDVVFLIIGDGTEKKRISDLISKNDLKNVKVLNPIPRSQYAELAKVCDIGLVNLSNKFTIPNIPSRVLSYWEAKLPVLAAIDSHTDFGKIIEESGSGFWSLTGDISTYKENFMKLYSRKDLRISMGESGYRYLLEHCKTSLAYQTIIEKLQ